MSPEELKQELGSTGAVAACLGVSQQTVKNWSCGRARPTAVTIRLLALLGRLKREAPDVFDSLIGWVGTDTRSVRERLDAIGGPSYVADYLGVSRPVVDAWRAGTTQRVATVVRLLDVLDYVRAVAPGVLGERPRVQQVQPGEAATVEQEDKRAAAIKAARVFAAMNRKAGNVEQAEKWEEEVRILESGS